MAYTRLLIFTLSLSLFSCAQISSTTNSRTYMEAATLWVQNAAEYKALTYQAYNIAQERLKKAHANAGKRKLGVVLDIDETVLDNSPYQAKGILTGAGFDPKSWDEWVQLGKADAVPGAIDFLKLARSLGVEIFYVSNRATSQIDVTYQNLIELGAPVKRENLYFRSTTSDKSQRRKAVRKNHDIVLFIGDVLADFDDVFEELGLNQRKLVTERHSQEFGRKFIVLPNPMYGDWERAFYNSNEGEAEHVRSKKRKKYLYPY